MDRRTPDEIRALLLEVARATASHRDLASLLGELADLLCRIAGAEQLTLVLHDPERDRMRLHIVAAREPVEGVGLDLAIADSPSGSVWQTQQPLVIPSIERETRFTEVMRRLLADGMRSLCVLPLTSPLRRLGGLGFSSREENAFQPADVEFLQQLTSQVALAVDNTLHHESTEHAQRQLARERDRLSLLLEINNALVSNLEPRALFSTICQFLRRVVAHEYTSLGIYDAKQNAFDLWAIEFAGKGLLREHMIVPMEGSPAGRAFTAGKTVLFERTDLEAMSSEPAALLLAEGVQRMCSVPLTAHDRRLGALGVGRVGGEPFTPHDVEILAAVAKQVAFSIENALAFQEIETLREKLEAEKVYLQDEIRTQHNFEEIIGESPALNRILHEVETVAPTDSAVLITGETGSGKELIARALHALSARRERTFVTINCAAIPSGLLESELFGHERGAFTGAIAQRVGRFELADRGTLFLDEVGDIPIELQPKLLRVLQEREFERIGSSRTRRVDVRVVAATNRNLEAMVAAGTFRSDLYYRLNVFPIAVPPLRERPEDIPALVRYFVQKFARRMKKQIDSVPADGMAALCRYAWPGNVRELENAIERAVILSSGPSLRIAVSEFPAAAGAPPVGVTLEAAEREAIVRALGDTNWVLGGPHGAAARLGLKRTTLQSRMRKLGIDRSKAGH